MKYLSLLLFVTFSLGWINSFTQSTEKTNKISLKLYSQVMANSIENDNKLSLRLVPTISLETIRGHFHELELNNFRFSKQNNSQFAGITSKTIKNQLGARYSFNYSLNKTGKFKAYLGAGVNSLYLNSTSTYSNENITDETSYAKNINRILALDINITPRVIWNVSDKWFLDINIPVSVINTEKETLTGGYDAGMQSNEIRTLTFPNKYTVNVGIGFKF